MKSTKIRFEDSVYSKIKDYIETSGMSIQSFIDKAIEEKFDKIDLECLIKDDSLLERPDFDIDEFIVDSIKKAALEDSHIVTDSPLSDRVLSILSEYGSVSCKSFPRKLFFKYKLTYK